MRIADAVIAAGKPLPKGTHQFVLTDERPTPLAGQSPAAQRWVAFVADGKVVAREIAEVLRDSDLPAIGASARTGAVPPGAKAMKAQRTLRHMACATMLGAAR